MKDRWRSWHLWVGLVISGAALALALIGVDFDKTAQELSKARYVYLVPAGLSLLAYLVARSVRWWRLLGPGVGLVRCFWVTNIGYLASNVLPFRVGDPARAVAIGLGGRVRVSAALSTVVVERVLDMLTVVLLLAATLPFVKQAGKIQEAGPLAGAAALAALVTLIALALWPAGVRRLARWCLARAPRLKPNRWLGMLDGLLDGLAALRSARRLAELLAWSALTWAFAVGYYWAMLWAFLDRPGPEQGSFLTCAIGLGMALPAAPGAMGVFESVARYALELPFGVPQEQAIAVAFVSHAFQYILANLLGLIGLAQMGLSLGQLRKAATLEEEKAITTEMRAAR